MPLYPNYSQMSNNIYTPTQNPYMDRMNYMPNYQQIAQQNMLPTQMSGPNQQPMNYLGKMVDCLDSVKVTDIPMDGNMYYFPKADGTEIFGKQWLQNGTTRILTFKPVFDDDTSNLSNENKIAEFTLSDESTKAFMNRFDELEEKISSLTKSLTKSAKTLTKKESDTE